MRTLVTNIGSLVTKADSNLPQSFVDAAILFENGVVTASGERHEIEPKAKDAQYIDAKGCLVTPGLIDAHTHLVFGGNRAEEFELRTKGATYEEIASAGGGILSSVRATRAASFEALVSAGKRHLRQMIATGTTQIEAKTGYGLDVEAELKCLRALGEIESEMGVCISKTLLALHAVPPEFAGEKAEYVEYALSEILPAAMNLESNCRPQYADIFVEQNYFEAEHAQKLSKAANRFGIGLRMHVDQLSDTGGATLATQLGAASADHLENSSESGIRSLSSSKTIPILLPASVFCLGKSKYPNARLLLDSGAQVALATDFNPGSSPTTSLPFVMALACSQMKMTPLEALAGCTVHAAKSLGDSDIGGTLLPGAKANFVLWDCDDLREIPYWTSAPIVKQTWINGEKVFEA